MTWRHALLLLLLPLLPSCGRPAWAMSLRTVFPPDANLEAECHLFDDPFENDKILSQRMKELYMAGWRLISISAYTSDAIVPRYTLFCYERRRTN